MEDNLKKIVTGRRPHFFVNGRRLRFVVNGRGPNCFVNGRQPIFAKWKIKIFRRKSMNGRLSELAG